MEKAGKIRAALLALMAALTTGCAATGGDGFRVHREVRAEHPVSELRGWLIRTDLRLDLGDEAASRPSILDLTDLRVRALASETPVRLAPASWTCSSELESDHLPAPEAFALPRPAVKYREPAGELFADPPPNGLPFCPMTARGWQATEDSFLWSFGTGIADEELGSRWTCAAITDDDTELPALQIWGSTFRSTDSLQFAPGFFWKPASNLMLNVTMLMDMAGDGPGWGLLVSLVR